MLMKGTVGVCGALLLGGFGGFAAGAQQIQVSPNNRTIAVTTTESAERRADIAVVHIGYQLYGPTSDAVVEAAGKASKAIADAEKQLGVAPDAIESDMQSTEPVPAYEQNGLSDDQKAGRQFRAQQGWTIRTTAAGAAKVLAAAVAAGANQSGSIGWSVADDASLNAEAAGNALKHAHEIAEQMAAGLGAKLGPLVYASNEAQNSVVVVRAAAPERISLMNDTPSVQAVLLNLSPPMVTRSATVSAVFSIL